MSCRSRTGKKIKNDAFVFKESRSLNYFITEFSERSTLTFIDALYDYERSNKLLFGDDEQPKLGGWRLPQELERQKNKNK